MLDVVFILDTSHSTEFSEIAAYPPLNPSKTHYLELCGALVPIADMYLCVKQRGYSVGVHIWDKQDSHAHTPEAKVYAISFQPFNNVHIIELSSKLGLLRDKYPHSKLIVGGGMGFCGFGYLKQTLPVHAIAFGDGTESLLDFIQSNGTRSTRNSALITESCEMKTPALWRKGASFVVPPEIFQDLINKDVHRLENVNLSSIIIPIVVGIGCQHNCAFCSNKAMYGQKSYFRSVQDVYLDIERVLCALPKPTNSDEKCTIMLTHPGLAMDTCRYVFRKLVENYSSERLSPLYIQMCVEAQQVSPELIELINTYGDQLQLGIFVGVESLLPEVQNFLGQKATPAVMIEALRMLASSKAYDVLYVILFGFPIDTPERAIAEAAYSKQILKLFNSNRPKLVQYTHLVQLLPYSRLYNEVLEGKWSDYYSAESIFDPKLNGFLPNTVSNALEIINIYLRHTNTY
jgi:radical SAM superfamily enzyme YgiQ (UPF0313 family)